MQKTHEENTNNEEAIGNVQPAELQPPRNDDNDEEGESQRKSIELSEDLWRQLKKKYPGTFTNAVRQVVKNDLSMNATGCLAQIAEIPNLIRARAAMDMLGVWTENVGPVMRSLEEKERFYVSDERKREFIAKSMQCVNEDTQSRMRSELIEVLNQFERLVIASGGVQRENINIPSLVSREVFREYFSPPIKRQRDIFMPFMDASDYWDNYLEGRKKDEPVQFAWPLLRDIWNEPREIKDMTMKGLRERLESKYKELLEKTPDLQTELSCLVKTRDIA